MANFVVYEKYLGVGSQAHTVACLSGLHHIPCALLPHTHMLIFAPSSFSLSLCPSLSFFFIGPGLKAGRQAGGAAAAAAGCHLQVFVAWQSGSCLDCRSRLHGTTGGREHHNMTCASGNVPPRVRRRRRCVFAVHLDSKQKISPSDA